MKKLLLLTLILSQIETTQAQGKKKVAASPTDAVNFQTLKSAKKTPAVRTTNAPVNATSTGQPAEVAKQTGLPNQTVQAPQYPRPNISSNSGGQAQQIMQTFLSMLSGQPGVPGESDPGYSDYLGGSTTYNNEYGPAVDNGEYGGLKNLHVANPEDAARFLKGHTCSENDSDRLVCMVCNLMYEAGNQDPKGQLAVAQSVMTRTFSGAYEDTVCKNVYKKTKVASGKWVAQYSWTLIKEDHTLPSTSQVDELIKIASNALRLGPNGYTNYFAHDLVTPKWFSGNCYKTRAVIQDHTFCKINGTATRSIAEVARAEGLSYSEVKPQTVK